MSFIQQKSIHFHLLFSIQKIVLILFKKLYISGNEIEETEDCVSELEDSNDSWQEEYSPDFIMRYSSR